jgi:hypothetical protein
MQERTLRAFPSVRLLPAARVVRRRTGKSLLAQVREITALRRGPGLVKPFDYYAYELFDDSLYSSAAKQDFAGWNFKEALERLWIVNEPGWLGICDDKLIAYGLFHGLQLPYPEVYAVYHPDGRTFRDVPCIRTADALADHLRQEMRYPFFGKPVGDAFGRGAASITAIDRDRDLLIESNGHEVAVDEWVRSVPVKHYDRRANSDPGGIPAGYMFQARIVQHPLIERLSGGRVSTLRMVVLRERAGPRLFRVSWKLPVGDNITDHAIGTSGNVKCWIDPESGRVEHVLRGRGPEGTEVYALGHYGSRIEAHPDTGEKLIGITLPDWDRAVALCLRAATAVPGLRYQSWDVVLGADGPMLLELNFRGGILQMPGAPGLNDATFRRFMTEVVAG